MTDLPIDTNFKSTLPPRKRAKTKEEKEQRRVERILRNRRAAHASREKKRKHVEYLESYVLKLEQNLMDLQSNHDEMAEVLTEDQRRGLSPRALCDLSDLKEKIHSNLNSSVSLKKGKDDDLDDDDLDAEDDESTEDNSAVIKTEEASESPEVQEAKNEQPENDFLQVSKKRKISETESTPIKDVYYNYLSPILINSPMNSPIDLTLGKGPSNSYDLLGQNSAAPIISEYMDFSRESSHSPSATSSVSSDSGVDDFLLDNSNNSNKNEFDEFSTESSDQFSFMLDQPHQLPHNHHQIDSDFGVNIEDYLSL